MKGLGSIQWGTMWVSGVGRLLTSLPQWYASRYQWLQFLTYVCFLFDFQAVLKEAPQTDGNIGNPVFQNRDCQ